MLLPPTNLFRDDFVTEYDLHRFRDYLFENSSYENIQMGSLGMTGPLLMDVLMKEGGEGNEQDLEPFDPALLKPLQNLPPGKIPGITFDSEAALKITQPLSIFSLPAATITTSSSGNSPKRRKIDTNQQNITIQHF
jgi:hypothetical protein